MSPPNAAGAAGRSSHLSTFWLTYAVLFTGLAFSLLLGSSLRRQYQRREEQLFNQKSSELAGRLDAVFLSYGVFLRGVGGLFAASQQVTPKGFQTYLSSSESAITNRALLDIGFAEIVRSDRVVKHLDEIRKSGNQGYRIQAGPEGLVNGVAYPITHIKSLEGGSVQVIGWDMGQDPARRQVIEKAISTRQIAVSDRVEIHRILSNEKSRGMIVVIPVFPDRASDSDRIPGPSGIVFGSLVSADLWRPLAEGIDGVQFRIFPEDSGDPKPAFDSSPTPAPIGARRVATITRLGRSWRIETFDSPEFREQVRSGTPANVTILGILFTAVLSVIATVEALRRRDAERAAALLRVSEAQAVRARVELEERERQVADERDRLEITLRSIGDAVVTTDPSGRVLSLNPSAEKLLGCTEAEVKGREVAGLVPLRNRATGEPLLDLEERLRQVTGSDLIPGFFQFAGKDQSERTLVVALAPLKARRSRADGRILVLRDLTERRQLEEEQIRAGKLESVGLLAGGIAHDFNNYLTAVLGNLSLAHGATGDELEDLLERTEHGIKRAQRLTQQLLTFSKGGAPVVRPTDLRELVQDTAEFATRGKNVRCDFDLAPDLWPSEVDPAQISRVVQNLAVNAAQAMPDGGVIRISARNHGRVPRLGAGRFVRLSVQDEGPGITAENLPRIFEPYFSTKSGGSGLGLATAFRIVRQHRGDVTVTSDPGCGATFDVFLPASDLSPVAEAPVPSKPVRGVGRVLVMDDEQAIRDVARAMLRRLGYEVDCVANGDDAVALYRDAREHGKAYDVVLLDLTVPEGLGGLDTMQRLLNQFPDVVAVVSSGYSSDPIMAEFQEYGFAGVLPKPYRLDEMAGVMDRVRRK
jgi:PAS domain S-box-containing protein